MYIKQQKRTSKSMEIEKKLLSMQITPIENQTIFLYNENSLYKI